MVRRSASVLLAVLLWGCPDDIGTSVGGSGAAGLAAAAELKGVPNGGSEIRLTWKDRAADETGYRLEISLAPFGTSLIHGVEFLDAGSTSCFVPAVPDTTYYFRVVAITAAMESAPSNVAVVRTPNVPSKPTGVVARPNSPTQIGLSWQDVEGENGYLVERSPDEGKTWIREGVAQADLPFFTSEGLSPATTYLYRVIATGASGNSTPSDPVRGETAVSGIQIVGTGAIGNVGRFTSLVLASNGLEHLSTYDLSTFKLVEVARTPVPPSSVAFKATTVDAGGWGLGDVGGDGTDIALDPAGKVHIVAHDRTSDQLRYVTNSTGTWTAVSLASGGARPRMVCDAKGTLHVASQGRTDAGALILQFARKVPGQPWEFVAYPGNRLQLFAVRAVALDDTGRLCTAIPNTDGGLELILGPTKGGDVVKFSVVKIEVPATHGSPDFTSVAMDGMGVFHILYRGSFSRSLHHLSGKLGQAWEAEPVDEVAGEDLGSYCAAALDRSSGRLHVASYDATRRMLRYARKDPDGLWVRRTIDAAGDVGSHAAIAVDGTGAVHIAYRDETNKGLKIATGSP